MQQILAWFREKGVTDITICPGGRNAPFVVALEQQDCFSVVSAFDERAAGFFAFGQAYEKLRPSVVITTSGTAVAELLPSVIEAYYTQTPLIVVTADRPQVLRGTGSPQVIEQAGLFGPYVESACDIDWDQDWEPPHWTGQYPLHINIAFEEPLIDGTVTEERLLAAKTLASPFQANPFQESQLQNFLKQWVNPLAVPLLIVGPLHSSEVEGVKRFCRHWPGLIYAEASSGLREMGIENQIVSSDKWLSQVLKTQQWSGVLRVGGVPTVKLWRELENNETPVVSMSARPFSGLARGEMITCDLTQLPEIVFPINVSSELRHKLLRQDREMEKQKRELLHKYPLSEPAWVERISKYILSDEDVYIGNSLPIREWDDFAEGTLVKHLKVNRGANGIDGQLVSALGMGSKHKSMTVILGDLTALYDSTGLWFKDAVKNIRVVVINNNGGRIFERLFKRDSFYNTHSIDFSAWARMWKMDFCAWSDPELCDWLQQGVIEVLPHAEQTQEFWREYGQLYR